VLTVTGGDTAQELMGTATDPAVGTAHAEPLQVHRSPAAGRHGDGRDLCQRRNVERRDVAEPIIHTGDTTWRQD
jgi:hypothetical protein